MPKSSKKLSWKKSGWIACALVCTCWGGGPDRATAAWFEGVGDLPGGPTASRALGVSPDGTIVVGASSSGNGTEAFRWEGGVLTPLGDPPGGIFLSSCVDVSVDGSVLMVGLGLGTGQQSAAVLWTDGLLGVLEDFPTAEGGSRANGISGDGSVVIGTAIAPEGVGFQAVRWIDGEVGALIGGSMALAVSGDGRTIAGFGGVPPGRIVPILWRDEDPEFLDPLYPVAALTEPRGISANGEVMVGFALLGGSRADGVEAFRWENGVYDPLGDLAGGIAESEAVDASNDGSIVVGYGTIDCPEEDCGRAVFWDQLEIFDVRDYLIGLGIDMTGWTLTAAEAVSDDGLTIVGQGINPNGDTEGWIAFLPEPDGQALEVAALASLAVLRTRRRSRLVR